MLQIYSISDMTDLIRNKLEKEIPDVLLRGEVSECKFHGSGHVYLMLKDSGAVLPAVIWRNTAQQLSTLPAVGMDVIVYGRLNVYPPQGKYQFIIQTLQDAGRGELYVRFEALKAKLIEEGLCDPSQKKPLPQFPMHVGIVTSESAAALQDMLRIFSHDAPHVRLSLSPAQVQGKGAARSVIDALELLKNPPKPDCVICARGGGSIEDLWEFNDEALARYIADYPIPLITGIGHETDNVIADFVSDYRASTPTNAAETVCKYWRDVRNTLNQYDASLASFSDWFIDRHARRLLELQRYLSSRRIAEALGAWEEKVVAVNDRLARGTSDHFRYKNILYEGLRNTLLAYAPQQVLKKGYVLVRDKRHALVASVGGLRSGDDIRIEFHDGFADAGVKSLKEKGNNEDESEKNI
ncbi:MAG: exodeoxyribonuclease VII large subunit [FCB group bacterium]|nr:exodeoxyribonuclease VII large subunit [FCB group bacterium]